MATEESIGLLVVGVMPLPELSRVKRVFGETGTRSQSDLLRLLLTGPAPLRLDEQNDRAQRDRDKLGKSFL